MSHPYRRSLTPTASLVDLYVDLSRLPAAWWAKVRRDGGDIRVTKQDGLTPVPCGVVGFDAVAKTGALFLKTNSGTAFYLYYGNSDLTMPGASSPYGSSATWEAALKLLLHGTEYKCAISPSRQIIHTNGISIIDGSASGCPLPKAFQSSLDTDIMRIPHDSGLSTTNLTMSGWWYFDSTVGTSILVRYGYQADIWLGLLASAHGNGWATPRDITTIISGFGDYTTTPQQQYTAGHWYHVTITYAEAGYCTIYFNGVSVATGISNAPASIPTVGPPDWDPANPGTTVYLDLFNQWDLAHYLRGKMCGFRWYDRILSDTEVSRMYANQSDNAGFVTIGDEEFLY